MTGYTQDCSNGRYLNPIFNTVTKIADIQYGEAEQVDGSTEQLMMDVYYPDGDVVSSRPTIVFAHGGSFISGERADMDDLCREYAKLGYVTATISYRLIALDLNTLTNPGPAFKEELIRSLHDMKAAVRFLRRSVAEEGNPYGIDTNTILVGGVSAGSIIADHLVYLEDINDVPADLVDYVNANGGLEGNSGNPGYGSDAIMTISLCGAINDTTWMREGGVPYVGVHNLGDQVVPNLHGYPNIGIQVPVDLYGDSLMYVRAQNVGIRSAYMSVPGDGHCDFPEQETFDFISQFTHDVICGVTGINDVQPLSISLYPNPTKAELNLTLEATSSEGNLVIYDMTGRTILSMTIPANQTKITVSTNNFAVGNYLIRIIRQDGRIGTQQFVKQ